MFNKSCVRNLVLKVEECRMEKRRVTISIGGQPCTFYTDDSDDYIAALQVKVNEAIRQFAGNYVHAMIHLTDQLLRKAEIKPQKVEKTQKNPSKKENQVSMWDMIEGTTK